MRLQEVEHLVQVGYDVGVGREEPVVGVDACRLLVEVSCADVGHRLVAVSAAHNEGDLGVHF